MTSKQRFIKALKREEIKGHVPHFELVFFLTMEAFGKVHPSHRKYEQWNQMSYIEQKLHMHEMADIYIETAKKYNHDAIFVHPNPGDYSNTKWLLEIIREKSEDNYFLMLHGDTTVGIPNGTEMVDFAVMLYEEPQKIHDMQKRKAERAFTQATAFSNTGLLDGFALCSDYGLNANPFFPKEIFAELILPHLKECISTYRELGYYSIKHTDGNIEPILDLIVDCNPDALHSIDPQGGMNLLDVRQRYGDRICTIGNVNCGLLQTGTEKEAVEDINRCINEGMAEGFGFIFSTSNCVYTGLPLKRYELMHKIWQEKAIYN